MYQTYDFAIIGGDKRQIYMAKNLLQKGYSLITYGLNISDSDLTDVYKSKKDSGKINIFGASLDCLEKEDIYADFLKAKSLEEAIEASNVILTPIPITKDKKTILSTSNEEDLTLVNLMEYLTKDHILYGGCLTKELIDHCQSLGITYCDFMGVEEITLFNTIATAEGTIVEAIKNSNINLHGSSCLILGYGRCAKTLAEKLKPLCGSITIAARSNLALASASTSSFNVLSLTELEDHISEYQFIFNTIPAMILNKNLLEACQSDVVIIDIASNPGGVDFQAADTLGLNAQLCLGIPGKYAPKASADFLIEYLLKSLGKK